MLSRWIRSWDGKILRPLLLFLGARGVTPNLLTLTALAAAVAAGTLIALGHPVTGAFLLLLGGGLDALDGELARLSGADNPFGGFLDSVCDHLGDGAVSLGLAFLLVERGDTAAVLLVLAAQFGSLLGSQVRSRGAMAGIDTRDTGIFTRLERILVLFGGLATGRIAAALWVLAAGNNLSAVQRIAYVVGTRRRRAQSGGPPSESAEITDRL